MGILSLIGFGHPLTDLLEKELTQMVVDRYKAGDKTFTGDISSLAKDTRRGLDEQVKQLFSVEDSKVKKNWKEFKSIVEQQEREAIKIVLKNSSIKNYSEEKYWEILSIPKDLLLKLTTNQLPDLLAKKIQFADMEYATRLTLAKYAVEIKFNSILSSLKSDREILDIEYRKYVLVEEKKDDHYYIDDATIATRKAMLFFSEVDRIYSSSTSKEAKSKAKEAFEKWKQHSKQRPDNRRFKYTAWK